MNIERVCSKEKPTTRELRRYMEISFQVAMGFRPQGEFTNESPQQHVSQLTKTDPLISGYVWAITLLN